MRIRWRGLELPNRVQAERSTLTDMYGKFFVEPFDLRTYARSAAWPSLQAHRMIGFRAVREP